MKKIVALAVSASARSENHKALVESGFYIQFKNNLNISHPHLVQGSHDNELYGLLNIALNSKYLYLIWQDLRKLYKIVFKNKDIIDYRTKVDLFSACAKYISRIEEYYLKTVSSSTVNDNASFKKSKNSEKQITLKRMTEVSIKAMVYCLMNLIKRFMKQNKKPPVYSSLK